MGGFSIWHWLIVLAVVVLIFGTKKLPGIGKDIGDAMRGFKKGLNGDDGSADPKKIDTNSSEAKDDESKRQ